MEEDSKKTLGNVVQIDEKRIKDHLGELVRGTIEETLNGLLSSGTVREPASLPSGGGGR